MGKWIKCRIKDIGEVVGGGTPPTKVNSYYGNEISWITPKDLSGYNERFIYKGERNITQEGYYNSSAKLLPANSILFSSRAPIGYVAIAGKELCTNQGFKSIIPNKNIDFMFLYYLLKYNRDNIINLGSGTTFKEISGSVMNNVEVKIPVSIIEQKKIAKILSILDDKIELNNKLNDNLEELVNNLFIKWFVHFKNDELNDSINKSSIPEGWIETTLESTVREVGTGADAIQRAPIVDYDTGIKCVRVGDMTNKRPYHEWGYCKISDENYQKYKLEVNDIVVTRTASNGLSYIVLEKIQAVCNNGLIRLKVNEEYNPLFVYLLMQTQSFYDHIHKIDGETSTRPNMKIEYLLKYKFVKPRLTIQNDFVDLVRPMLFIKNKLINENKNLIELQDTLLPKLMSGEIDVDNFELNI